VSGRPATGAEARTLRSLGSSLLIYRAFGLWNPLGLGDEGRMLAVLERVFLLERHLAVQSIRRRPGAHTAGRPRRR
jgi:hypothetical protein